MNTLKREEYNHLIKNLEELHGNKNTVAIRLCKILWQFYKDDLWSLPNTKGERYPTFEAFVLNEIGPLVNQHNHFSPGYLGDAVRTITRFAYYLYLNPVYYPDSEQRITPEEFLEKAPMRAVKQVSQHMRQGGWKSQPNLNKNPKSDELIRDIMMMSSSKVVEKWNREK
jgi:hypothetical protein